MIDIHMHILPGVDDGSPNMESSLALADASAESGVDSIVATPHCYPGLYDNDAGPGLEQRFAELDRAVRSARIPVRLYQGMEIFGTVQTPADLEDGRVWTLNGTQYFLVEFAFDGDPVQCSEILDACARRGFIPVIAHPERYFFIQDDPRTAYRWVQRGYALQLNGESILGRLGEDCRQTAYLLLSHGLASCAASDAHRMNWRPPACGRLREILIRDFGRECAYMLLEENPLRILEGRDLVGYEAEPFE